MQWSWLFLGYHEQIVAPGKQPILFLLAGLVLSFGFIRTSTRLIRARVRWWPGNVSAGGIHLHHELFGVVIMLAAGTLSFAVSTVRPWREALALLFGVGAGLVLDEFALLLRLRDVYWSAEGRTSIDAVAVAVVSTAMLAVTVSPFGLSISRAEVTVRWVTITTVGFNLCLTVITALKGKPWMALLSVAVPTVGLAGACRLASATSPWARRRYRDRPDLRRKAAARTARWKRRKQRLVTLIGGAPSRYDHAAPLTGGLDDVR
jgi:hypothetical protein